MNELERRAEILRDLISMEKNGKLEKAYYDGIPIDIYHHGQCPGVSSTKLKNVDKNKPAEDPDKPAFVFGRAFHSLVLEPHLFAEDFSVGAMDPGGRGYISFPDYNMLLKMKLALSRHNKASDLLNRSIKERTFFSRDKETGILKKCRTDSFDASVIADLKTCASAEKSEFAYACKKFRYGFSAAYYVEIVSEVMDTYLDNFQWIAVEKSLTPRVALYHPNQQSISRNSIDVRTALETYKLSLDLIDKPFIGPSEDSEEIYA